MSTTTTTPAPAGAPAAEERQGLGSRFNLNALLVEGRALDRADHHHRDLRCAVDNFLTAGNLMMMTKHVAINAILALGMLMVILNGGIDLSVGSIVGLTGVVAGNLLPRSSPAVHRADDVPSSVGDRRLVARGRHARRAGSTGS